MSQGMHLSQRLALQQVLAPQLQQSLALLQAPVLELRALVEQELQQNPVLEESQTAELDPREPDGPDSYGEGEAGAEGESSADGATPEPVDDFQAEFDRLVQLDDEWREHFSQTSLPARSVQDEEERHQYLLDSLVARTSLQEHLMEQVRTSELSGEEQRIAELIVGNTNDQGFLQASVDELVLSTGFAPEQITTVLQVVQGFHPPGVCARDIRECLMLQLERAGRTDTLDYRIIRDHMAALVRRRLPDLARALSRPVADIQEAVERIGHLEPRPGRDFEPDDRTYVVPELAIERTDEGYAVRMNNDSVPHLRISNTYKDLMAQADAPQEVRDYIRDKIRAGKFVIKSIQQRQSTIAGIAEEIIHRQGEFLAKGVSHLRPMTMAQVAEAVGVHETTVSRAVAGKYIETPQGVFEMKSFFTSGVPTAGGSDLSSKSVKDMLGQLVAAEDPKHPLSDDALVRALRAKGVMIARRTVAKYRMELNILPSHLRRSY